jgi:hypothetical protein
MPPLHKQINLFPAARAGNQPSRPCFKQRNTRGIRLRSWKSPWSTTVSKLLCSWKRLKAPWVLLGPEVGTWPASLRELFVCLCGYGAAAASTFHVNLFFVVLRNASRKSNPLCVHMRIAHVHFAPHRHKNRHTHYCPQLISVRITWIRKCVLIDT